MKFRNMIRSKEASADTSNRGRTVARLCRGMALLLAVVMVGACSSSEQASNPDMSMRDTVDHRAHVPRQTEKPDLVRDEEVSEKITLTFDNGKSEVTVPLDPDKQDFMLELSGEFEEQKQKAIRSDSAIQRRKEMSEQKQDSLIEARTNERINNVMKNFRQAQNLLYRNDYETAMKYVDRALEIAETAEAKGLKGTIFFMQDNMKAAKYWWNQAVEMDPNITIPDIPELRELIDTNTIEQDTASP